MKESLIIERFETSESKLPTQYKEAKSACVTTLSKRNC